MRTKSLLCCGALKPTSSSARRQGTTARCQSAASEHGSTAPEHGRTATDGHIHPGLVNGTQATWLSILSPDGDRRSAMLGFEPSSKFFGSYEGPPLIYAWLHARPVPDSPLAPHSASCVCPATPGFTPGPNRTPCMPRSWLAPCPESAAWRHLAPPGSR